jgi:transaldolase/glucose-6-phosphate isomerase
MLTLEDIKKTGQSLWLDNLRRDFLLNGALGRLMRDRAITGLTSNPSIFEKALLSPLYAEPMENLFSGDLSAEAIFEILAVEDIQRAADLLKPVHEASGGRDGFVSMEVSPKLARDAARTEAEGLRLAERVGRPNLMIKVPATKEGLLAGENLLKKGVSVNFTLIFSVERYRQVAQAYVSAIAWRGKNSLSADGVSSVASFFVSRIDTAVDKALSALPGGAKLKGRAGVANSLLAYKVYRELFYYRGALTPPQRILWASTSVKDPAYRPSMYMEELALPGSVNTAPEEALEAYFSDGRVNGAEPGRRCEAAAAYFTALKAAGVDFGKILTDLETEGIEKFSRSYDGILALVEGRKAAAAQKAARMTLPSGADISAVKRLADSDFTGRLWKKDPALWKEDEARRTRGAALGWLDLPFRMLSKAKEITSFAQEVRADGFTHAVLLGMGGSSLAAEVLRGVFQDPSWPRLFVLDSSDPSWIDYVRSRIDVKRTLFIYSSKSGGTIEPACLFRYFWSQVKAARVKSPGQNFVAITDPGTLLDKLAKEKKFRKVFHGRPDIGGRFSALSYYGLVPAALCGADVLKLLERAVNMASLCKKKDPVANPGAALGALAAAYAGAGRDKLTLVMPEQFGRFGLWVEQLIAESTGKEGKGIVPVCLEPQLEADKYQTDRFFVRTRLQGRGEAADARFAVLEKAGHPVYTLEAVDAYDIGAEFFRWETAAAAACSLLGVNPFDQPDVQGAKLLTLGALAALSAKDKKPRHKPDFAADRIEVYVSRALKESENPITTYDDVFWSVFSFLREKEYIALLAYLPEDPKVASGLAALRETLARYTSSACTLAYGPRYLHASGQLHKGGPNNAFFVILTSQPKKDILVPGEKYTFWQLEMAQALGDFEALDSGNRRVLRLHLKHPLDKSLAYLSERIARVGRPGQAPAEAVQAEESEMLKLAVKKNNKTTTNNSNTTTKAAKLVSASEYVVVDYPKNLETIAARHYSVRIGASDCTGVEISVNDQPWQACRHAVGYWWFDWNHFQPGTHQLVARMHMRNGEYLISKRRRCKVI